MRRYCKLDAGCWTPVLGCCPHDGISARSCTRGPRTDAKGNTIAKSAGRLPRHRVLSPLMAGGGCGMRLPTKAWVGGGGTKGINAVN